MSEPKTRPNRASVTAFVDAVEPPEARRDCRALMKLLRSVTGKRPVMWGDSIIGYGAYAYTTGAKHSGEWPTTGLSPRRQNLTVYVMNGFSDYADLMKRLGPHKKGKSCLYIKRLSGIDMDVLREILTRSVAYMREHYACR